MSNESRNNSSGSSDTVVKRQSQRKVEENQKENQEGTGAQSWEATQEKVEAGKEKA